MYSGDMIVNLMAIGEKAVPDEILIKRAFPGDRGKILAFIKELFGEGWAYETEMALLQSPPKCWIAVTEKKVIGFACYDASAKDYFGPIGVDPAFCGKGIGEVLLRRCLISMREEGYGYAIIGWVGDAHGFYEKTVGARYIEGGDPDHTIYKNLIAK